MTGDSTATTTGQDSDVGPVPTTGESTGTTPEPLGPPEILHVELDPETLEKAAPIAVQVEALHSDHVTMALDGAQPVPLTPNGTNSYEGAIEVYGASMNGDHTVVITATRDGQQDLAASNFAVHAPAPGKNMWLRTSDVPASQTHAIAVDPGSNVYEVGTVGTGIAARLAVSKRDDAGDLAWPGTWITFTTGESRGEDVAIGPDGTIYVLGNVEDNGHTRWWLAQLDPASGSLKQDPQLGEIDEPARGLSIAPNGDLAIVGCTTVWGAQDTEDIQTMVWFRPVDGGGVITEWGYSPTTRKTNSRKYRRIF